MLRSTTSACAIALLKAKDRPVPVSGYDTFAALVHIGALETGYLANWNALVGIRNRIFHDYMNIALGRFTLLFWKRNTVL